LKLAIDSESFNPVNNVGPAFASANYTQTTSYTGTNFSQSTTATTNLITRVVQAPLLIKLVDAATIDLGKWIPYADINRSNTGADQRVGAGGGLSEMATRFQGDIKGGTSGIFLNRPQRLNLGMRAAEAFVPALANEATIPYQHGSHHGIGFHSSKASVRQSQ